MSPDQMSADPGYVPRLLTAAAFVTRRATDESLTELRLTQERSAILAILSSLCTNEQTLAETSGLEPACVRDCVQALEGCGYAAAEPRGRWTITAAGAEIRRQAEQAEARLLAGANDDGLRQELSSLIRALAPRPRGPGTSRLP